MKIAESAKYSSNSYFESVPAGESFNCGRNIYIKLMYPVRQLESAGNTVYQAINLHTGVLCCMHPKELVSGIGSHEIVSTTIG